MQILKVESRENYRVNYVMLESLSSQVILWSISFPIGSASRENPASYVCEDHGWLLWWVIWISWEGECACACAYMHMLVYYSGENGGILTFVLFLRTV